jgi:hypothetical protein
MDRNDPLLSHQYEAVFELSKNFETLTVITGKVGLIDSNLTFRIINTNWMPGKRLRNIYNFYLRALPIIVRGNFDSVFFHMTDLQCALLSPLISLRGKRQYLWYAHTYKSKFLIFSSQFVNRVVTSTLGSCPLSGPKVVAIGQAINENQFRPLPGDKLDTSKLIHVGRFDK